MQPSTDQMAQAGFSAERLAELDRHLSDYVTAGKLGGIVALLARGGQIGYFGAHGLPRDAIFRIYSMTKPVTAAAVMALWDDGLLQFSDPLARFLPEFADLRVFVAQSGAETISEALRRPITLHDLLTHTSGLAYGLEPSSPIDVLYQQERLLRGDEALAEKMTRLARLPLLHQPGERVTYSISFDVLSRVVEVVSGQPFDQFLRARFFNPLEMPDSGFAMPAESLARLAPIYAVSEGQTLIDLLPLAWSNLAQLPEYVRAEWIDKSRPMRFLSGGGGLVASMEDYFHFAQMLANQGEWHGRRILSQAAVQTMASNQLPAALCAPGLGGGYGLGVITNPDLVGLPAAAGAFGGGGAAGTEFWVDPGSGMLGVFMVQIIPGGYYPVAQDFKLLAARAVA